MQVTIDLSDEVATELQQQWKDLSRKALELLVVEAYRQEILTHYQVGQILGLESRFAVDAFLKQADAYLHYDETDLEDDRQIFEQLRREGKLKI